MSDQVKAAFRRIPGSAGTMDYGTGQKSNVSYVADRRTDGVKLIKDMLDKSVVYDWRTAAGSNLCTKIDLGYCSVTENRYHDYLPVYCLKWVGGDGRNNELFSDDFVDVIAEIMRRWW